MRDRNFISQKVESLVRQMHVRLLPDLLGSYTVNEYPKSGGSWVGGMLSEALRLPFPQHAIPEFRASILHGHYIHPQGMRNVVCVWRDGRDVMVSWYFHCTHKFKCGNEKLVEMVTHDLGIMDAADVKQYLPKFIEYSFTRQSSPPFSWSDFVRTWSDRNVFHVKYEDLLSNPVLELMKLYHEISGKELPTADAERIVEKFSFERMSGRKSGSQDANSFFRKGIAGDWKNYFTDEAVETFKRYAGDELIHLGYESDMSWGLGE